ncbi:MAG: amidohydrolase family protein, partial [Rhodospirillales bacterium]|nr:amidohydrolase family protein [Rhodospirillales bacterium]
MDYDIKITGGTIIDGTGAPGYSGDVGIADGRIAALGDAPGAARSVIAADGRVVCPGFVDIHTHYDAQIMWDPMLSFSPWHGVTTCVMGNCGFGIAPTRPQHRDLIMRTLEKVEAMSYEALDEGLGAWPFEIGLWVGKAATPNRMGKTGEKDRTTARKKTIDFQNNSRKAAPLPVENCPWCGT